LALFTPLALAGTVFYLFHHIVVKANLFLVSGVAQRYSGSFDLKKLGGLCTMAPWLSLLFFIPAMSLGGIPPLSGFFAKFAVVKAAFAGDTMFGPWAALLGAVALGVGLLTLFSMTKIWAEAFWKPAHEGHVPQPRHVPLRDRMLLITPIAALAVITLGLGFFPGYFFAFAETAAAQLLDPQRYIDAVLGGSN